MGGNAIKGAFTRRYSKQEFDNILPIIIEKAKKKFTDAKSTIYFKSKESFGDADILVLVDKPITFDIKEWLIEEFNSKEVVVNSHVYSFEFNEIQVDFILTPLSDWETAQTYFSYTDLHNLIGKVAHKFGLKHGYKGLKYVYRIDGKVLGEITVTRDRTKTLDFLGFDSDRYDLGFDNLDEIFDYVTSSKYFNPWLFDFETLNRINRERNQKRATYAGFVNHVAPLKEKSKEAFHYFYNDKKVYLGLIDHFFPGFLKEYRALEKKEERKRTVAALFNGDIIMKYSTLKGKELGSAINKFRESFTSLTEMEDYILLTNDTHKIMKQFSLVNKMKYID